MLSVVSLAVLCLLSFQCVESRSGASTPKIKLPNSFDVDLKGISDVWNSIKNTAQNAWSSIKDIAEITKEKLSEWMAQVKIQVKEISAQFEIKIKEIREETKRVIESIMNSDAAQLVKECLQKENEAVNELLEQIAKYVAVCISDATSISRVEELQSNISLNETEFYMIVTMNMENCLKTNNADDCLVQTRKDLYNEVEKVENKIFQQGIESRGVASDLLDTVIACTVKGLIDASNVIAAESLQIISCILKG